MSISLENECKWSEKIDRKIKLRNGDSLKRNNTNRAQNNRRIKKHKTGDHIAQGFTLNFTHEYIVRCSFLAFRSLLVAVAVVGMTRMHTNEFVYHANFIFIPWKFVIVIWCASQCEFLAQYKRVSMYFPPPINLSVRIVLNASENNNAHAELIHKESVDRMFMKNSWDLGCVQMKSNTICGSTGFGIT